MKFTENLGREKWTSAALVALWLLGFAGQPLFAAEGQTPDAPSGGEFIRFIKTGANEGHVDTATKTYLRSSDNVLVSLIGVVHIADGSYYDELQRLFENYDAVLYEMVRDRDIKPTEKVSTDHPVSQVQIGMKNMLDLEFQLDRIDYGTTNFVHADLDPTTFSQLQAERGESIFGLLFKAAMAEQSRQASDPNAGLNPFSVLFALASDDTSHQLKFLLGQQMGQLENTLAGVDETPDGKGSAILSGRNDYAMKVLGEQIALGKKKLAIFYGAGHMPDFEKRLLKQGFKPVSEKWFVAWDIRKTKSIPVGRD